MGRIYSRRSRKRWRVKTRGLGIIDVDATDTSENHDRDYHCIDVDVETRVSPGLHLAMHGEAVVERAENVNGRSLQSQSHGNGLRTLTNGRASLILPPGGENQETLIVFVTIPLMDLVRRLG